jgi:hypothetical protein
MASLPVRNNRRNHSAPVETPQMTALDRSDPDCATIVPSIQPFNEPKEEALLGTSTRARSNSWWEKANQWRGMRQHGTTANNCTSTTHPLNTSLDTTNMMAYTPLDDRTPSTGQPPQPPPPRTAEDVVLENCPFFFQEFNDVSFVPTNIKKGLATTAATTSPSIPQCRANYRARFQQLNALLLENKNTRYTIHVNQEQDELWLQDNDEESFRASGGLCTPHRPTNVADFSKSSFYCNIDGRVLMKLPKDKVRLTMDPHLEPGILSVEQPKEKGNQHRQELTYVLSVDDDLYRRVVAEISDTHSSTCGVHQCCTDTGHLNIQVAYCLLGFVLLLLLINTIIYPGD